MRAGKHRGQSSGEQWSVVSGQRSCRHSSKQSSGIPRVDPRFGDVFSNDGASTDSHMVSDCDRQDGGICPDTYMVSDFGRSPQVVIASGRASVPEEIIDKHYPVRNKTIVAYRDSFTDKRVRLNLASLSDSDVPLYFDEWADKTGVADNAPVEIHWIDHRDILAKRHVDDTDGFNCWLVGQICNYLFGTIATRSPPSPVMRLITEFRRLKENERAPSTIASSRSEKKTFAPE